MSLVTDQGRQAQAAQNAKATTLHEPLLAYIGAEGPVSVDELLDHFPDEETSVLRAGFWKLLDANLIRIDRQRRLVLV